MPPRNECFPHHAQTNPKNEIIFAEQRVRNAQTSTESEVCRLYDFHL